MKKVLLTTILAFALANVPAKATMVTMDYLGETLVTSNNIERTLIVNSDDGKQYNIAIRPLEEEIKNVIMDMINVYKGLDDIKMVKIS